MCNYYEETMPLFTNEEEYLKYYYDESLPIIDKLNSIIKKGQPFQRQALLKNLLIYEKESFFKSLINFIINDILTWDSETILLLPKSLYLLITNTDYILENELFNLIFKHMIKSVSSGSEKSRNEYTFYFNKIIDFYSIIDLKKNNKIKKNFFPYVINDDIIEFIVSLGIFGQTTSNRKLCCFLSSSLCRIMIKIDGDNNNNLNDTNIKKLYERLNYLFWDGEKMIEAQMVRELLYIIPIFKDNMFTNEDINQAIKSYINHDTDHIIQVMAIISVLKNIVYLNEETNIINILFDKIKEIVEDFDYESIYKNTILHILINEIYNNYLVLNPSYIYQIFKLGIMKNYYNFYKLDIFFIKNFDKYYFLINYFLDNAQYLENKYYFNNESSKIDSDSNNNSNINDVSTQENHEYQDLVEQIQTHINFEEYFIKIYNEIFLTKENNNHDNDTISGFNENCKIDKDDELLDVSNNHNELSYRDYFLNNMNNNHNQRKNCIDDLIFDEFFFEENIDIIFNKNYSDNNGSNNNFYNKEIIKKILFLYLHKIILCFPNLKTNRSLCDKLLSLFDKTNIIYALNIYSSSLNYIEKKIENEKNEKMNDKEKAELKKHHPLYQLFLVLLKKNLKLYLQQGKNMNKTKDNNNKEFLTYEGNIYNKLIISILTNTSAIYQETPNLITNDIHILIGKILNLLLPKFFKYYKSITYNAVVNNNQNNNIVISINSSFVNNKETIKVYYFEKIFEEIFNNLLSKIIVNNALGHHVLKEYMEVIPYFILYSKNRWKYYELFAKEIITSDCYYKRKYALIFFEKCFKIFSFGFICKNNMLNDFIILMKDNINLISTNAIEILYNYNKKIISYSTEKFQELCEVLNQIYDINIKAFNDNENKNKDIVFDKEKNIIINKFISINNDIEKYYTEEEINAEKELENKLFVKENEILKYSKSINNRNKSKNNLHNNTNNNFIINSNNNIEHKNINTNILQISSTSFHGNKNTNNNNNSIINSNNMTGHKYPTTILNNKNSLNLFNITQKEKNAKITPWIEKSSSGLFKDKKPKTNIVLNSFNKDNKYINNDLNNTHYNNRHNSTSKSITYNKHYLPKLRDLKINRKDLDFINNNIRSIDITFNKINTKIDDNEDNAYNKYNNINNNNFVNINNSNKYNKKDYNIDILSDKKILKNELRLISFTQNRIPSAKIKIIDSYPIMGDNNIYDDQDHDHDHHNLYIKNYDNEKKTSNYNQSNLKSNYYFNNKGNNNICIRSISNKHINMSLRPNSKNMRLKRDNNVSSNNVNKIYIDAGK